MLQMVNAIGINTENFSKGLQAFVWFRFKQFLSPNCGTDYSGSLDTAVPAD